MLALLNQKMVNCGKQDLKVSAKINNDMKSPGLKAYPEGLWKACDKMEMAVAHELRMKLSAFERPITDCYEAGVEVATIIGKRNQEEDMRLAAMFLKRTLTDLRSVWLLVCFGYTSQAAAVCAALFEHALSVNCLAGRPENTKKLLKTTDGDLPWSPIELSKFVALQAKETAKSSGAAFTSRDYDLIWREVYSGYKFLCKIKHPTLRSVSHDVTNTSVKANEFVVMAAPNFQPEDLPLKVTILAIGISRTTSAVDRFASSIECSKEDVRFQSFDARLSRVPSATLAACKKVSTSPLPFDISTDSLAKDYGVRKAHL